MRKITALLAVVCTVFVACSVMACVENPDEPTKTTVTAPVINSKVYNGETQAATIEATEAYTVIENNGGVNVGEYNVVLKLTDETVYKWKTPDEADATKLTLKFAITKAQNAIADFTLDGWREGETANTPSANAAFGEVKFAYSAAKDGTYTETVPVAAGNYFVKAYVDATENYDGAEAVISFEIIKGKEENKITVTAKSVKYGENVLPDVKAEATHVPDGAAIEYTYALTSDGEYVTWEKIEKRAGKYFVKATVAEDDDYKGAFVIAEFEMLKGDNAINDFVIADVTCKQAPALNAVATAGTAVTYKYATEIGGDYADMPADGFVAGTYYVKAYTAGDGNYAAAESNAATLTVKHSHVWNTDASGNDYLACACGDEERFVIAPSAEMFEKTESGYALKLYTAEDEGKANKVTFKFVVTLGTTVTDNAVMTWSQSSEGIAEVTGNAEYTIKAVALGKTVLTATYTNSDGKKAHVTIDVTVEKLTKTVTVAHERILADSATDKIDLSFASAYYNQTASLAYGDKVIGNGALNGGKLAVDLSGIAEKGELTLVASAEKDGVYYSFDVNVLLATKIIRNAADMAAVRITVEQLQNYTPIEGYYILGNDIDFANAQLQTDFETPLSKLKNYYWDQNEGFRGTFDGMNHKITNVRVGQGGIFGFVGEGAVIKNVNFEEVSYVGAYCGSLIGYSVINADLQNINVSVSSYKAEKSQGFLSAKFTAGCKYKNVKIDARTHDVISLFGVEVKSGTYRDVEIKVKSYTVFGEKGNQVDEKDKSVVPAGITVITTKMVNIEHETIILEASATEIDLSFANDYIGDTVSLTHNGKVLGDGAVINGKLAVDLSKIAEAGELAFFASTVKNDVNYSFDVNVILATKIIRNEEDLNVIRVKQENIDNKTSIFGYYVLGNDINLGWKTLPETSLTYSENTVPSYEAKFGFRGTFDGRGYTISRFAVTKNGLFGHVGRGAVIKNVNFDKLTYNKAYYSTLFGYTVRDAEIKDVNITLSGYNMLDTEKHCQGFLAARFMQGNKLTNVKIDAGNFDVYTVFGYLVTNNTCNGVEVKVKSYTTLGYSSDTVSDATMIHKMEGVTVITDTPVTE